MGHLLVAKEARSAVVVPGCASSSCVLAGISLYAMGCPAQSPGSYPSALPPLNALLTSSRLHWHQSGWEPTLSASLRGSVLLCITSIF